MAMLTMLDVSNAVLPTFVAEVLDRVPGLCWGVGDAVFASVDKLSLAVDGILKRMTDTENKLDQRATPRTNGVDIVNAGRLAACDDVAARESTGNLCPPQTIQFTSPEISSVAADIKPTFDFKVVRGRRLADCSIKAVP